MKRALSGSLISEVLESPPATTPADGCATSSGLSEGLGWRRKRRVPLGSFVSVRSLDTGATGFFQFAEATLKGKSLREKVALAANVSERSVSLLTADGAVVSDFEDICPGCALLVRLTAVSAGLEAQATRGLESMDAIGSVADLERFEVLPSDHAQQNGPFAWHGAEVADLVDLTVRALSGRRHELKSLPSGLTVAQLKSAVSEKEGCAPDHVKLACRGKILACGAFTLRDYGIRAQVGSQVLFMIPVHL
mmetsp:Transcript_58351/g.132135  ORF Transcript_58351/g.132135 Transcript_58351/m.132135 type:complete len:250 (-) Transcript_58351:230-979(-)